MSQRQGRVNTDDLGGSTQEKKRMGVEKTAALHVAAGAKGLVCAGQVSGTVDGCCTENYKSNIKMHHQKEKEPQ